MIVSGEWIVHWWRLASGGIVQVNIEQQGVLVVWVALLEFTRNSSIGWADIAMHYFAKHIVDVGDFGELFCTPIVKQACALLYYEPRSTKLPGVLTSMERARVEPKPVDSSSQPILFLASDEASLLVVIFPLLEWVPG